MMDAGPAGGDGRRRGKKNRQGRRKRAKGRPHRGGQPERYQPEPIRDESSILGARSPRTQERRPVVEEGPPDAFAFFRAFYLGVTPDDTYQKVRLDEVARRFGLTQEAFRAKLVEFRLDEETIRKSRFDLDAAQLDIRVAPEGISRTEIARELFDEYMDRLQSL